MSASTQSLSAIKDIKNIMERSSRFISLSGWSGISAGIFGLAGAWLASKVISDDPFFQNNDAGAQRPASIDNHIISLNELAGSKLFLIAILTFVSALVS